MSYREALAAKNGHANMGPGREHDEYVAPTSSSLKLVMMLTHIFRQSAVTNSSDDGSADEGVTVVDSPTNCKAQSSPIVKKETA